MLSFNKLNSLKKGIVYFRLRVITTLIILTQNEKLVKNQLGL